MINYNTRLIKLRRSYNITEIASLLGVDRRTCRRWIKIYGLKPIDRDESTLVMGDVLKTFLKKRVQRRKVKLSEDEFFCMKCRRAVRARVGSEKVVKTGKRIGKDNLEQFKKTGVCEVCNTKLNRFLREQRQD